MFLPVIWLIAPITLPLCWTFVELELFIIPILFCWFSVSEKLGKFEIVSLLMLICPRLLEILWDTIFIFPTQCCFLHLVHLALKQLNHASVHTIFSFLSTASSGASLWWWAPPSCLFSMTVLISRIVSFAIAIAIAFLDQN